LLVDRDQFLEALNSWSLSGHGLRSDVGQPSSDGVILGGCARGTPVATRIGAESARSGELRYIAAGPFQKRRSAVGRSSAAPTKSRGARVGDRRRRAAAGTRHSKSMHPGLNLEGVVAPLVFDGPINAQVFEAWIEQFLAPTLGSGDVVVMDNLSNQQGMASQNTD
jgi:hypothetical protein